MMLGLACSRLITALTVFFASGTSAARTDLPAQLRDSLQSNANGLAPVTVRSTRRYTTTLPQDRAMSMLNIMHSTPEAFFAPRKSEVTWQEGKIYSRIESGGDADEYAYDGATLYMGDPDGTPDAADSPKMLARHSPSRWAADDPGDSYITIDYLDVTAVRIPSTVGDMNAKAPATSEILSLVDHGGTVRELDKVEYEGRQVTRMVVRAPNPERQTAQEEDFTKFEAELRSSGRNSEQFIKQELDVKRRQVELPQERDYVYFLDPERGYAMLLKEERNPDGQILTKLTNSNLERVEGRDVWLPKTSVTDYYTWPGRVGEYFDEPVISRVVEVQQIDPTPKPEDRFKLVYDEPGTYIWDTTLPGGEVRYYIPAGAEELDRALESLKATPPRDNEPPLDGGDAGIPADQDGSSNGDASGNRNTPVPQKPTSALNSINWPLVVGVNAIILICFAAWMIIRHIRRI